MRSSWDLHVHIDGAVEHIQPRSLSGRQLQPVQSRFSWHKWGIHQGSDAILRIALKDLDLLLLCRSFNHLHRQRPPPPSNARVYSHVPPVRDIIALQNRRCTGGQMIPKAVGQSVTRVDARSKVTGAAKYPADFSTPDMLHAKLLFAGQVHARVRSIDLSEALQVPGVVAIFTAADVAKGSCPVRGGGSEAKSNGGRIG